MDIFRTLGSESLSVTAMLDFSGKANTSIHGLGEDDTAKRSLSICLAGLINPMYTLSNTGSLEGTLQYYYHATPGEPLQDSPRVAW